MTRSGGRDRFMRFWFTLCFWFTLWLPEPRLSAAGSLEV